ncbi:MAG: hypothetical protein H6Q02_1133, partial [Acidobacteria bacterium]|nr:hypothetical protein [Acidobacteriota bacterium]
MIRRQREAPRMRRPCFLQTRAPDARAAMGCRCRDLTRTPMGPAADRARPLAAPGVSAALRRRRLRRCARGERAGSRFERFTKPLPGAAIAPEGAGTDLQATRNPSRGAAITPERARMDPQATRSPCRERPSLRKVRAPGAPIAAGRRGRAEALIGSNREGPGGERRCRVAPGGASARREQRERRADRRDREGRVIRSRWAWGDPPPCTRRWPARRETARTPA